MKKYIKRNGELPQTPFKQGDIVTYESHHSQTNIILLNRIREERHGDIFFNTMLATRSEITIFMKAALKLATAQMSTDKSLLFQDLPELAYMMGSSANDLRSHTAEEWELL